jgi:hypothetical protein
MAILGVSVIGGMVLGNPFLKERWEPRIEHPDKTEFGFVGLLNEKCEVYHLIYTSWSAKRCRVVIDDFSEELQVLHRGKTVRAVPYVLQEGNLPEERCIWLSFAAVLPNQTGTYNVNLSITLYGWVFSREYKFKYAFTAYTFVPKPLPEECLTITLDKGTYYQGEVMNITIKNISNETIWFTDTAYNLFFERFNGQDWEFYDTIIGGAAMTPLKPKQTAQVKWTLGYPGRPYPAGRYRVGTHGVYAEFEVIANMISAPSDVFILKTDKVSYARGEGVEMTFTNGGDETVYFRRMPPFIIKNQQGVVVAPALLLDVILWLLPGGSFSWTWDQLNRFLDPPSLVPAGNYTVTVEVYNSTWGLIATLSTNFEIWEIELSQAELEKIVIKFLKTTDVPNGGWDGTVEITEVYDHEMGGKVVVVNYTTANAVHPHFMCEAIEHHTAVITIDEKGEVVSAFCVWGSLHDGRIWDLLNQRWIEK